MLSNMPQPFCFVLMPFGKKRDPVGGPDIDFDRIYEQAIKPAIVDADLEPVRADYEVSGGLIHKAMFERLLLCEFAVADLTTANANVFYELGVRHASRPHTTLMLFAEQQPIPFDVATLRAIPYHMGERNRFTDAEAAALRAALSRRLLDVRELAYEQNVADSPLVQLLQGYQCPDVAHLRTDVFRERVQYSETIRDKLLGARNAESAATGEQGLVDVEGELGTLDAVETGVLVDLYLSYRAVGAFDRMIDLYQRLPEVTRRTVLVREQLAFALNRKAGKAVAGEREALRERAIALLEEVIAERGANGETCGLLGRVYKDRWDEAREKEPAKARGLLRRAIAEYVRGFEADWRDAYPGVNAITLLDIDGSQSSLQQRDRLLPVVRYAVEQRIQGKEPDYWDHATLVELALIANQRSQAADHLSDALAVIREYWEPETTARNLGLLQSARAARGEETAWTADLISELEKAAAGKRGSSP